MAWTNLTFSFGQVLTSTQMTQLDDNFEALVEGVANAPRIRPDAMAIFPLDKAWGDASSGTKTFTTSQEVASGIYCYDSCTVNSGITLTTAESFDGFLVFLCNSKFTLCGSSAIDLNEKGGWAGGAGTSQNGGNGALGGGGGASEGRSGGDGNIGCPGGASGNADGISVESSIYYAGIITGFPWRKELLMGGGGGGTTADPSGAKGGHGGGSVIVIADTISFNGEITCNGGNGGTDGNGDGGGGGGGAVILFARTFTESLGLCYVDGSSAGGGHVTAGHGGDGLIIIREAD